MNWRVPFCSVLFALINMLMVSTGAARLAGVYTKRIATALTLFNTFILVSRMANLAMVPEIGRLADIARAAKNVGMLAWQFRVILGSATLGCICATLLIPTFVEVFNRGIVAFEKKNSIPLLFFRLLDPRRSRLHRVFLVVSIMLGLGTGYLLNARSPLHLWHIVWLRMVLSTSLIVYCVVSSVLIYCAAALIYWLFRPEVFRPPGLMGVTWQSLDKIPKDFIILNVFVQAFWTVGWMAAVFAGATDSRLAITSVSLSGIITGVSTIILTVFVDPKAALITDQAAHGVRTIDEVKTVVIFLTVGSVVGTALAQVIFTPAAAIIAFVASHI